MTMYTRNIDMLILLSFDILQTNISVGFPADVT